MGMCTVYGVYVHMLKCSYKLGNPAFDLTSYLISTIAYTVSSPKITNCIWLLTYIHSRTLISDKLLQLTTYLTGAMIQM